MLGKKMEKAINEQINAEMYSAYLYLSMATYFESENFKGFANWMRVQYQEETAHALKFFDYVFSRGGKVTLKAIDAPETKWDSPLAVFKAVYAHEQKVTDLINKLVDLAADERDHATSAMLQWFVTEQVEEEANADEIVQKMKMMGDSHGMLFMMDRELATRVFTPPTPAAT